MEMHGRLVYRWAWLGVLLLFLLGSGTASASTLGRLTPRIVGGTGTTITTYPFQVAVYYPSAGSPYAGLTCGGVIIDATHVATAAHCVFDETTGRVIAPGSLNVLAGTAHLNKAGDPPYSDPPVKNVSVTATSFHPAYNPSINDYDVAVLTLGSALYASPTTSITPVPPIAANPVAGSVVSVSGWGDINAEPAGAPPSPTYPQDLRAAQTHLVADATCNANYSGAITARMVCAGEQPAGGIDSCFGDSGGPLVAQTAPAPPPTNDALVGIVSFGEGCAQASFPGVYARVSNPELRLFLTSGPPQAPQLKAAPSLSGTPSPGQTVSCNSGGWTGGPGFTYRFARDLGGGSALALTSPSAANTYTVQASDAGTNLFCEVRATNTGGYGLADSPDVSVPRGGSAPPPPPPPAAAPALTVNLAPPRDTTAPAVSIASKSCRRGGCVVNVRVTDPIPSSGIRALQATLSWKTNGTCRRRGRRVSCTRTHTRHPTVKAIGGGHFLVSAGHLKRGTYSLSVIAVDKAGNRPRRATVVALKLR